MTDSVGHNDGSTVAPQRFALNDVVICIDYRENRGRLSLLDAMRNVTVRDADQHSVLCTHMRVADAIILRVVSTKGVVDLTSSSSSAYASADATAIDENVTIDGAGVSSLLADRCATQFVAITVYERKGADSDFVSSCRPKSNVPVEQHLDSQVKRLCAFTRRTGARPYLLLEGYLPHAEQATPLAGGRMQESEAHSILQKITFEFGITVWNSANTTDSARTLHKDARMTRERRLVPSGWVRLGTGDDDTIALQVKKSANRDARTWYLAILQAIDRVSAERAKVVAARYPTLVELMAAYDQCASLAERRALLAPLETSRPTRKRKKNQQQPDAAAERMQTIGKTLSCRIFDTVYGR